MWRRTYLSGLVLALMAAFSTAFAQVGIKINEVAASSEDKPAPDGSAVDWVELINTTAGEISLGNASLTDNPANPRKWIIPAGVSVPANGRLVILMDADRPVSTNNVGAHLNAGFGLGASGDQVILFASGVAGPQLDSVTFGAQVTDLTIGRVPDGTGLWALTSPTPNAANTAVTLGAQGGLRINEWMASPASGDDWFEIYNTGARPVQLGGLYLTDIPDTTKLLHRIPDLSFIGTEVNGFTVFFASGDTNDDGEVAFRLSAGGEKIGLYNSAGTQIDLVEFGQQTANVSEGRIPDGGVPRQKFTNSATPGDSNYLPFPGLVVSEVLTHTDLPLEDAVEFYNTTDAPINIGGWWLSNRRTLLQRYQIPPNTMVPAKGYIVLYERDFNNPALGDLGFGFSSAFGDQVYLSQSVNGQLTGYRVGEEFEAADNGVSIGRVETSLTPTTGDYKFVALTRRTFGADDAATVEEFRTGTGAPNAGPRIGPVVVNEIMYHPPSLDGGVTDNVLDEYIELRNITPSSVPLYDTAHQTNKWRLKDAVSYTFQGTPSIPPFGYILVVAFDPVAQPSLATAFRAKYNVPSTVQLYGPFTGALGNGGDGVELYRPDTPQIPGSPNAGFVPQIRVDKVNYLDAAPWPTSPDGTGQSLQKKNSTSFGNDPINWEGVAPTAGRGNPSEIADTDLDGMPDSYEDANGFNKNSSADAGQDADNDGFTNLQEYLAGTNPKDNASFLSVSAISHDFSAGGTTVKIRFTAVAGKSYSVQYRNSFSPATVWQKLADVGPQTATGLVEVSDLGAASRTDRYYRVVTPSVD